MTLNSRPVQMLLAVVIAVVLGPPIGALAVFLCGFGMYAGGGYPWSLSPSAVLDGLKMVLALIVVAYVFASIIALAAGIMVALWMLWRPPSLAVVVAASVIAALGYAALLRGDLLFGRDNIVTVLASAVAATGCWFLTRRFVRAA